MRMSLPTVRINSSVLGLNTQLTQKDTKKKYKYFVLIFNIYNILFASKPCSFISTFLYFILCIHIFFLLYFNSIPWTKMYLWGGYNSTFKLWVLQMCEWNLWMLFHRRMWRRIKWVLLKEIFDNDRILLKNSQDWKKNIVARNLLGFIVFITCI